MRNRRRIFAAASRIVAIVGIGDVIKSSPRVRVLTQTAPHMTLPELSNFLDLKVFVCVCGGGGGGGGWVGACGCVQVGSVCALVRTNVIHHPSGALCPLLPPCPGAAYLQDPPSLDVLCRLVVPRVSSRWDYVGLQLGMSPECLEVIEGEHKRKDGCCTAMFKEWLRGAPGTGSKKRSWELVLCAVETGHGTTAEEEIRKGLREVEAQPDYQAAILSDKVKARGRGLCSGFVYVVVYIVCIGCYLC